MDVAQSKTPAVSIQHISVDLSNWEHRLQEDKRIGIWFAAYDVNPYTADSAIAYCLSIRPVFIVISGQLNRFAEHLVDIQRTWVMSYFEVPLYVYDCSKEAEKEAMNLAVLKNVDTLFCMDLG